MFNKFILYFFISIFSFTQNSLLAQSADLSGTWTGYLRQQNNLFSMGLDIKQKENLISGTTQITLGSYYAVFNITGNVKGTMLQLYDISISEENSRSSRYWCKKIYFGKIIKTKNGIQLVGNWKNDKRKMFYKTELKLNVQDYCPPGTFELTQEFEEITNIDTTVKREILFPVPTLPPKTIIDTFPTRPVEIKERVEIISNKIRLTFYDNGEIDNDTITVYYNKKMILNKKRLTSEPLNIEVEVDSNFENELVMYADNEGSIPPNTAVLIFYDDGKRHEISMSSSLKRSEAIFFLRKPK
ncbi:MAG: hypothetical protein ABI675_24260 [Chitinophagaceae bacterium]